MYFRRFNKVTQRWLTLVFPLLSPNTIPNPPNLTVLFIAGRDMAKSKSATILQLLLTAASMLIIPITLFFYGRWHLFATWPNTDVYSAALSIVSVGTRREERGNTSCILVSHESVLFTPSGRVSSCTLRQTCPNCTFTLTSPVTHTPFQVHVILGVYCYVAYQEVKEEERELKKAD